MGMKYFLSFTLWFSVESLSMMYAAQLHQSCNLLDNMCHKTCFLHTWKLGTGQHSQCPTCMKIINASCATPCTRWSGVGNIIRVCRHAGYPCLFRKKAIRFPIPRIWTATFHARRAFQGDGMPPWPFKSPPFPAPENTYKHTHMVAFSFLPQVFKNNWVAHYLMHQTFVWWKRRGLKEQTKRVTERYGHAFVTQC